MISTYEYLVYRRSTEHRWSELKIRECRLLMNHKLTECARVELEGAINSPE